jgi:murein DD-endopeptidase MepM/ murein hydrolase activator NlpD
MALQRIASLRRSIEAFFPERHLYVRSGGEVRAFVLSTNRQIGLAAAVAAFALWTGIATGAMAIDALSTGRVEQALAKERAKSERWVADREARLNSAVAQLTDTKGSSAQLTAIEKRQAALAMLISEISGEAQAAAPVAPALADSGDASLDFARFYSADTERLITLTESAARTRADRLRLALRLAGLDPASYVRSADTSLGGPLIEAKDPRALAAILDVDEDFARRIQRAANESAEFRVMNAAAEKLPLARPADVTRTSGYGVRLDPFTRRPAFHSGLDFSGAPYSAIYATGPGVVAYTGVRNGYGNVVEIDHGGGFKTRYAHLATTLVKRGEAVALGQRIAGMGSTGRSTGTHLHYEVWVNGRAQNPARFLRAGDYVQQTNEN